MRRTLGTISLVFIVLLTSCAQLDMNKIGTEVGNVINKGQPLTNDEVVKGLKEALNVGSKNASSSASQVNGFFNNSLIKIPFPPEAATMEANLRALGMNKQVDDFILTLNRAAEEAAKSAAPVFLNAITGMSITDGFNILRGADTAATAYLRRTTSTQLHDNFKPIIQSATQKVDVTRYWNPLITTYNKIPFVTKLNPDLNEYITARALNGLFYLVSQEEVKIRRNPAARVSDILKRVFGSN